MKIAIDIPDEKVKHFTSKAKNALEKNVKDYAKNVIKEAERVEADKDDDSATEITASHIILSVKRVAVKPAKRKKRISIIMHIIADILLAILGALMVPERFVKDGVANTIYITVFIAVVLGSILMTCLAYFGGDN